MRSTSTMRPSPPTDPHHLGNSSLRVGEMMEGTPAIDHIKGFVGEWQALRVGLLQQDIADPLIVKPLSAEVKQRTGQINPDDLAYVWSNRLSRVGGAAGHIEDDHPLVQGIDPRQCTRSAGKGRVRPGEQGDLTLEGLAYNCVVITSAHRNMLAPLGRARPGRSFRVTVRTATRS